MKLKSNQTRTYDGDGYKKRAACLCFRSESEEEVRRRLGVAGSAAASRRGWGGGGEARPSGDGVPGLRAGRLGSTQMKFRRHFLRRRRGRKEDGGRGEGGRSPALRRAPGGRRCPPCQWRAGRGERAVAGEGAWWPVSRRLATREGQLRTCQPGTCVRRPRGTGAGRPFVAEKSPPSLAGWGLGRDYGGRGGAS